MSVYETEGIFHRIAFRISECMQLLRFSMLTIKKCDQEHPECRRCQRVKVTCPGYRHENDLIFVDVSNQIRERGAAQRPRNSRKNTTEGTKIIADSPRKQRDSSSPSIPPPTFTILPRTDWNQHALCRFMSEFTMETHDLKTNPGFLHNLPQLYREASGRDPLLDHAVMAVSLAHHSNQLGSYDVALQARKLYGVSISLLNHELSEGNLQSESTLIAVLFLNYYQVSRNAACPMVHIESLHEGIQR